MATAVAIRRQGNEEPILDAPIQGRARSESSQSITPSIQIHECR